MTDLSIRLLGTLEVVDGTDVHRIRGDLPRALLARLAWSAGETLTAEQLIADVWRQAPESSAGTLRAYLSRLRSAALGAALVGGRNGYLLDVPRERVDAVELLDRVAALGGPRADEGHLATLIELARLLDQPLVAGLDGAPFLTAAREQLSAARRAVEEDLGETAIALGDPAVATAVLEGTVTRSAGHERPVRLLATALAHQTRFADAIDVLDAHTQRSEREGIAGSPRIAALRASIVRQDPAIVAPASATRGTVTRYGVQIPLTRFIGRAERRAHLRAARETERLITIVGPAGVGKTRIALELAREATTAIDDEQYLVDLADVRRPELVLQSIATTVRASAATIDAIAQRLSGRRALLVLDNADHVVGALAVAAVGLLDAVPSLRLLVTSREPLRVPTEYEVVLAPFGADEVDDAWRLLAERASDARGGDPFDDAEEAEARMLCTELDGTPLALELAAARLDVLDVAAVRSGLDAWAGEGRHASVQNAISWTFELLGPTLQRALIHAGRFAGPFTVEAFAGIDRTDVDGAAQLLRALVGKSLLKPERSETGRGRFRLLPSTHEFVAGLDDVDDAAGWRARHRRWFAGLVWDLSPALRAFEARDAMAVLDGFEADLDDAMDGAVAADDRTSAVLLAGGMAQYWHLRGRFAEGRSRLDAALALPVGAGDGHDIELTRRATPIAELELANLAYQLGDAQAGFAAIAAAQAHGAEVGDASTTAVALARAAYGHSLFGDPDTSAALIAAAGDLAIEAQPWARSEVLMCRGQMLRGSGELDAAITTLGEARRAAESVGYTWMVTSSLYVLAKTLLDARRAREAIGLAHVAAIWARDHEDAAAGLALLHVAAGACASVERHEIGARLFGAVDALGVRYGYSTAAAEGDDATRLRQAVASGLPAGEFDREYRGGRDLDWHDVMQLVERLPQTPPADQEG